MAGKQGQRKKQNSRKYRKMQTQQRLQNPPKQVSQNPPKPMTQSPPKQKVENKKTQGKMPDPGKRKERIPKQSKHADISALSPKDQASAFLDEAAGDAMDPALTNALLAAGDNVPSHLHQKIMDAVREEPMPRRFSVPFIPVGTIAAAAVIVILLISQRLFNPSTGLAKSSVSTDETRQEQENSVANGGEQMLADASGGTEDKVVSDVSGTEENVTTTVAEIPDFTEQAAALVAAHQTTDTPILQVLFIPTVSKETVLAATGTMFAATDGGDCYLYDAADQEAFLSFLDASGIFYVTYNGDAGGTALALAFPADE